MAPKIEFLDRSDEANGSDVIFATYVDGPYDGQREVVVGRSPPSSIVMPEQGGAYAKSVRCADDGALRYVWVPTE